MAEEARTGDPNSNRFIAIALSSVAGNGNGDEVSMNIKLVNQDTQTYLFLVVSGFPEIKTCDTEAIASRKASRDLAGKSA